MKIIFVFKNKEKNLRSRVNEELFEIFYVYAHVRRANLFELDKIIKVGIMNKKLRQENSEPRPILILSFYAII